MAVSLTSFAGFQIGDVGLNVYAPTKRRLRGAEVLGALVPVIESATHKETSQQLFESVRSPAQHDVKKTNTGKNNT